MRRPALSVDRDVEVGTHHELLHTRVLADFITLIAIIQSSLVFVFVNTRLCRLTLSRKLLILSLSPEIAPNRTIKRKSCYH